MEDALQTYTPIPAGRPGLAIPGAAADARALTPPSQDPSLMPAPAPAEGIAPSGQPFTGDEIRDLGDANDEARRQMELDELEEGD